MTRKKKLAVLMLTSTVALTVAVGGATYALFTSQTKNENNQFTAGTVHLKNERDMGDTIPGPMFYSGLSDPTGQYPYDTDKNAPYQPPGGEALGGWAPGDHVTRAMNLYNDGTLDALIKQLKATVSGGETSGPAYDEFIQKMHIKVQYPALNKVLYDGNLAGLLNGYVDISPPFVIRANPSGAANITFDATLANDADNLIQGKTFVFDFTFYGEQKRNNP